MEEIYVCQRDFLIPDSDDDGKMLETSTKIKAGTFWHKDNNSYRICDNFNTIRLENEDGKWLELLPEMFSKYFKIKEK